jgi:ankyrin repeat protein
MIDEIKLRLGEESKEVLQKWLNLPSKDGYTPIHYACFRGNIELIIKLTENFADYKICNLFGLNCLHVSAQGNKPQSLIYMIEKFKLDINSKDKVGSTPIHWACYTGSENALSFILAQNPDINVQDKDGYTPLHLAVISGFIFIIFRKNKNNQKITSI